MNTTRLASSILLLIVICAFCILLSSPPALCDESNTAVPSEGMSGSTLNNGNIAEVYSGIPSMLENYPRSLDGWGAFRALLDKSEEIISKDSQDLQQQAPRLESDMNSLNKWIAAYAEGRFTDAIKAARSLLSSTDPDVRGGAICLLASATQKKIGYESAMSVLAELSSEESKTKLTHADLHEVLKIASALSDKHFALLQAVAECEKTIKEDPDSGSAIQGASEIERMTKLYGGRQEIADTRVRLLKGAQNVFSNSDQAERMAISLAEDYIKEKAYTEALSALQNIGKNKTRTAVGAACAYASGKVHQSKEDIDKALVAYQEAVKRNPGCYSSSEATASINDIYSKLRGGPDTASNQMKRIASTYPKTEAAARANCIMGEYMLSDDKVEQAEKLFLQVMEWDLPYRTRKHAEYWLMEINYNRADKCNLQRDLAGEISALELAFGYDANRPGHNLEDAARMRKAWMKIVDYLRDRAKHSRALEYLDYIQMNVPEIYDDWEGWAVHERADVYFQDGKYDKSMYYIDKIISETTGRYGNWVGRAKFKKAQVYARLGDYASAVALLQENIKDSKVDTSTKTISESLLRGIKYKLDEKTEQGKSAKMDSR